MITSIMPAIRRVTVHKTNLYPIGMPMAQNGPVKIICENGKVLDKPRIIPTTGTVRRAKTLKEFPPQSPEVLAAHAARQRRARDGKFKKMEEYLL